MRGVITVFVTVLAAVGLVSPAVGVEVAKPFSSCAALNKQYPTGLAKSRAAADAAVVAGRQRPKVSAKRYRENARLDKSKAGFVCTKATPVAVADTIAGPVTIQEVSLPKAGQCREVPVSVDLRNVSSVGAFGLTLRIIGKYGNVVGYQEVPTSNAAGNLPNGVYPAAITVCGQPHEWVHSSGNRREAVEAPRTDDEYEFRVYQWLSDREIGYTSYEFTK